MFNHYITFNTSTRERGWAVCTCGELITATRTQALTEAVAKHLREVFETQMVWGKEWAIDTEHMITTET